MPKSKGAGSPSPKFNTMDKAKDLTADVDESVGVFTRSRARRMSITVPDQISPPKKSRRSSISKKAGGTETVTNESRSQDMEEKSTSFSSGEIDDKIVSKSNGREITKSSPSQKKRKSIKGNECETVEYQPETEEQESGCTKTLKSLKQSCQEVKQKNILSGVKSAKSEKSRKSKIMESIIENETIDDVGNVSGYVQPSVTGGAELTDECPANMKSGDSLNEERSMELVEKSRRKLASKSTPSKLELAQSDTTTQAVSKKSVTPAKLSSKKADVTSIEKTPKGETPSSFEKKDNTPLLGSMAASAGKLSNKKITKSVESTPKNLESPAIEYVGKTPPTVSKNVVSSPKASTKKSDVETAIEKTPKPVESPLIINLDKTPLPVSKKAKLSAKKADFETTAENAPKATGSPLIENLDTTLLPVSKKTKLSPKKAFIENESTPNEVELPLSEKIIKIPQPISVEKLAAKKSVSKDNTTPKKIDSPTVEMLAKTPVPVLKKPTSTGKLSAKKAVVEDDTDSDEDSDAESRKEIMRSAEKRIIRNLSTSESESRNHVKVLQLPTVEVQADQQMETSSGSDSAPEDVTFEASRQSALELLKQTVDSIKRDKQKKKEKRKERLDIWRQRKEENLIRLKESKANRDDASCSSSEESLHERNGQLKVAVPPQGKKTQIEDEPSKPSLKRLPEDIVNNLADRPPKVPKIAPTTTKPGETEKVKKNKAKKNKVKKQKAEINGKLVPNHTGLKRDLDFKKLSGGGPTTFGVVALEEPTLKTVSVKAANFKQNLIYGNQIRRMPASTLLKNRKKLQVNMK